MPFSRHPRLPLAAAAFGALPALFGLQLLADPLAGLSMLGYPHPAVDSSQKLAKSLMRFFGSRDLALGLIMLAVWRIGDTRMLGVMVAIGTGVTILDGFINEADMSKGGLKHWIFVPVGSMIGGGLLGWFDGLL